MQLKIFKTLWGFEGYLNQACLQAVEAGFNGIEGQAPELASDRKIFHKLLDQHQLGYIAEITTAGSYVPERKATPEEHLQSLKRKLEYSAELKPLFITCLAGCDAWPEDVAVDFFNQAIHLSKQYELDICFETHRSRCMFNPWVTLRIAEKIPEIKITADFSHWCVVCERLMDSELDTIKALTPHIHHIHARVGYEQGPQVPHPNAPEYEYALRAHQRWWQMIWQSHLDSGCQISTLTPEFGPDGYLQSEPFTQKPVADLWEINQWMAQQQIDAFKAFIS